jgi:hypothetical protein
MKKPDSTDISIAKHVDRAYWKGVGDVSLFAAVFSIAATATANDLTSTSEPYISAIGLGTCMAFAAAGLFAEVKRSNTHRLLYKPSQKAIDLAMISYVRTNSPQ